VNGQEGSSFENNSLLGGDSLLILISATIENKQANEIYQAYDSLMFQLPNQEQNVKLLTWAENVNVISGEIPCNSVWDSQKPYLLKDVVSIPAGCSLRIAKGTRIYAFNGAKIEVEGSLQAMGEADSVVKFRYFRREYDFENALGAWRGIYLQKGSSQNTFVFTELSNATIGISVDSSEVFLQQVVLRDMAEVGVFGRKSKVLMQNTLITNCILGALQATQGGEYELVHCTFTNYEYNFNREEQAGTVFINENHPDTMKIRLFNSIFWGNLSDEIIFSGEKIDLSAGHSIFRTTLFEEALNLNNNLVNLQGERTDSLFTNPRLYDFSLPSISPAVGKGISTSVGIDILGKTRKITPDIGAYER